MTPEEQELINAAINWEMNRIPKTGMAPWPAVDRLSKAAKAYEEKFGEELRAKLKVLVGVKIGECIYSPDGLDLMKNGRDEIVGVYVDGRMFTRDKITLVYGGE